MTAQSPLVFAPGRGGRPPGRSTWKFADGTKLTFGDQSAKARLFDKMVANLDENDLAMLEAAIAGRRVSAAAGSFSMARLVAALPLPEGDSRPQASALDGFIPFYSDDDGDLRAQK